MIRTALSTISAAAILLFAGCGTYSVITVKDYKTPVPSWDGPQLGYVIETPEEGQINWIWGIDGFENYEWGTAYKLKVRIEKIKNPPADSPSRRFKLIKITASEKVDGKQPFSLPLKLGKDSFVTLDNSKNMKLMDEVQIIPENDSIKRTLVSAFIVSDNIHGNFIHDGGSKIILVDCQYTFNKDIALWNIEKLFPDSEHTSAVNWEEKDFLSFISDNMPENPADTVFGQRLPDQN